MYNYALDYETLVLPPSPTNSTCCSDSTASHKHTQSSSAPPTNGNTHTPNLFRIRCRTASTGIFRDKKTPPQEIIKVAGGKIAIFDAAWVKKGKVGIPNKSWDNCFVEAISCLLWVKKCNVDFVEILTWIKKNVWIFPFCKRRIGMVDISEKSSFLPRPPLFFGFFLSQINRHGWHFWQTHKNYI